MKRNEIILEKRIIKFHKKQWKGYYYFRYDGVPKCIILNGNYFTLCADRTKELARDQAIEFYKKVEMEE